MNVTLAQTETMDKLFLELSQFSTAKTAREIRLENLLKRIAQWDMMDSAADGPYWRKEIAEATA